METRPWSKAPSRKVEEAEAQWWAQFDLDDEPEEVVARREIAEMPDLLARYRGAIKRLNKISSANLRHHIDLGRIGLAVKTDKSLRAGPRGRIRADSGVKLLATALGMYYERFRESLKLVETFTADQIEMVYSRKSNDGWTIMMSHLRWIALIESSETRNEVIEYYYAKSPTHQKMGNLCIRHQRSLMAAKASAEAESALDEPPRAEEGIADQCSTGDQCEAQLADAETSPVAAQDAAIEN